MCLKNLAFFILLIGPWAFCQEQPGYEKDKAQQMMLDLVDKRSKLSDRLRYEYRISEKYRRGNFLIYDCEGRHFACVNQESFGGCKERREKALNKRQRLLPCVPLKKYQDINACLKVHYKKIHHIRNKSFCLNKRAGF